VKAKKTAKNQGRRVDQKSRGGSNEQFPAANTNHSWVVEGNRRMKEVAKNLASSNRNRKVDSQQTLDRGE